MIQVRVRRTRGAARVYGARRPLSKAGRCARAGRRLAAGALLALLGATALVAAETDQRPLIGEIDIEGNETFSDGQLEALLRTRERRLLQFSGQPRFVRDWLHSDLTTLAVFYRRAGFPEVTVSSFGESDLRFDAEHQRLDISIHIVEGKRRYLRALRFAPSLGEAERDLRRRLVLQPGQPFDPEAPGMDEFRILRSLQEQGYFAARVEHELTLIETPAYARRDSVDLEYRVDTGPPAQLAALAFEGASLDEELIRRELTVAPGQPLRLEQILRSKQNLLDSGYFRSVDYRLEALDPSAGPRLPAPIEELRLVWRFRERKMAALETGVGYGSVDGLRLLGGWTHRNLFGHGQRVGLQTNFAFAKDRAGRFGLGFEHESLDWRFLDIARLRARLGLLVFREVDYESESGAFSLETRAIRLSAARRLDADTVLDLRQQFDFLYQRRIADLPLEPVPSYNTRSLGLAIDRDTRDDFFNPTRGGHSWLSYKLAGGLQGGDHHFQRLQLNMTRQWRLPRSAVAAGRFYLGGVWPYGESRRRTLVGVPADGVPFQERFYCGGGSTVRGYDENSLGPRIDPEAEDLVADLPGQSLPDYILGGRFALVGNLEWRLPLPLFGWRGLGSVLFLDGGGTWESLDDIAGSRAWPWQPGDENDTRRVFYGLGGGLRYLTPLTVIRVDFGLPLQSLADRGGRWHFSLGQTF